MGNKATDSKAAYEEYQKQGGVAPDGGQLPAWDNADDATKQHVAAQVQAREGQQPPQ